MTELADLLAQIDPATPLRLALYRARAGRENEAWAWFGLAQASGDVTDESRERFEEAILLGRRGNVIPGQLSLAEAHTG